IERYQKNYSSDILVEEFVSGREFCVGVFWSRGKYLVMEPAETVFTRARSDAERIITENLKWNLKLRKKKRIVMRAVSDQKLKQKIIKVAESACRALGIDGYARLDLRLDSDGNPLVIDVNPN